MGYLYSDDRDSLGGNAKTFLVAALSATEENFAETLSTLKFAQRAKMVRCRLPTS